MNLVKKLAITLALTSTITLASCGTNSFDNLTATVGSTSSTGLTETVFILPETSKENHYISIIGHFDTEKNFSTFTGNLELIEYKNHKDYRITYQISKEDYTKISLICGRTLRTDNLSSNQIDVINEIISNYEAIEVVDLEVSNDYLHDDLGENFRFDEEKYLESLENIE